MIKRALFHVEDMENLLELASYLNSTDWKIFSANKTEEFLRKNKLNVIHEAALDEYAQYGHDIESLQKEIIETISETPDDLLRNQNPDNGYSLICINATPKVNYTIVESRFREVTHPSNFYLSTIIRTAFQNYENILILTDPTDYKEAIIQLRINKISPVFKTYLAAKALNFVSAYDAGIATSILHSQSINQTYMNYLTYPYIKKTELSVGSNKQQSAALYKVPAETGALSGLSKEDNQGLTYNIANDVSNAWELVCTLYTNLKNQYTVKSINADGYEFTTQFTPVTGTVFTLAIKFGLIIGAALSNSVLESFNNTYNYDKEYIKDVTLACSSVIDEKAAAEIVKGSFIAIIAPGFTEEAKIILSANKRIKLISTSKINVARYEGRLINGGLLIQTKDKSLFDQWHVLTKNRPVQQISDEMAFGMLLTLGIKSYSAILIRQHHIVAIAQSCTSCEKAISEVLEESKKIEKQPEEAVADILVCGSPITFTESVKQLINLGIYGIIQPGGNSTDNELTQYCDDRGLVMVVTDMTHYNY